MMINTLKGITWDHPRGYQPLIACSKSYQKAHQVRVEWSIRSLLKFGDQSLEELCDAFDLIIIDHPHVGIAAHKGLLEPMNNLLSEGRLSELADQSTGPSFFSYAYNGYQWAIPIDAAMQTAAYRPDLLPKEDIPSSWNQVFDLAGRIASKKQYVGIALSPTDCLCAFLTLTAQAKFPIKECNSILTETSIGIRVLQQLRRMKEMFHPSCLDWTPVQLYDYMTENNELVYSPLSFCYSNYSRNDFCKHVLFFTDPPDRNNSVLGGAGIAVSAGSNHKNLAKDYINWISSSKVQRTVYVTEQGQPGNVNAWMDEKANQITNGFFEDTIQIIENSYVRPRYYGWTSFQKQLGNIIHEYLKFGGDERVIVQELDQLYQNSKLRL